MAGNHYRSHIQHWDYVVANNLDYFQGQITKYVTRWKKKNGLTDLMKAQHFLEKYIEVEKARVLRAIEEAMSLDEELSEELAAAAGGGAGTGATELALRSPQSLSEPLSEISGSTVAGRPGGPLGASQKFVPEGFRKDGDMWRCRACKAWVTIPQDSDPRDYHFCTPTKNN